MRPSGRKRTGQRRRVSKPVLGFYKLIIIVVLVVGGGFISHKLYQLWQYHQEMELTLQQQDTLMMEHEQLKREKDRLEDPDEIARQAREDFGLVKPGEVPYVR